MIFYLIATKFCEKSLRKFKKRLREKELTNDYDQMFKEYEKSNIIEKVSEPDIFKESGCVHYFSQKLTCALWTRVTARLSCSPGLIFFLQ